MTEIKALKEILKMVISEINKKTHIEHIEIDVVASNDEFYIMNKFGKSYHSDVYYKIDFSLKSIKKFVEDTLFLITKRVDFSKNMYEFLKKYPINVDNKKYIDILGYGLIYKDIFIKIKDDYKKYVNKIREKLDANNIRVVYYNGENLKGFYVDSIIRESDLILPYVKDLEKFKAELKKVKNTSDLKKILDYETVTLYYDVVPNLEIEQAIDYIKKLVN